VFVRIEAEGYPVHQLHIGNKICRLYAGYFAKRKLSKKTYPESLQIK
jgi:hypothetical protein